MCLLIQFPDVVGTISQQEVDNFCNQAGYSGFGNNGSVYDYFLNVSDSRLRYKNAVTAYYTAQHSRNHYTDPAIPFGTRARELILEALTHLQNTGFNFAQLSSDSGGFIYALNVFYAGPRVNAWSQGLWPHAWALASPFQATPTKKFNDYQITDMGTQLTIGTFCHENGHMVCDFPDLYDYGSESNGVGDYCLMCFGGPDRNPTEVSAYLKNEAGWASNLTTMQPSTTYSLPAGQNSFLIHPRSATEYFILENRQRTGRDAGLPDAGLAIWHVDELGNNSNEQMTSAMHYQLSLEQADGRFDLERAANGGDSDDLHGAPGRTRFGVGTAPNSNWWDGTASGLDIISVSAPASTMTVSTGPGPALVVNNFGYNAGGWRVDMHPRLMADTTGDRRADIVGFGNAGVYVSRANADGTFGAPQLVVNNFGYNAGGWRVDMHPRFMADTSADGRADIVGFGNGGVYVSRANANGTFGAPQLVVANFGYNAGGWRVDMHPRFMADTTGDRRADIVGFGNAGVYVSRANADGTFSAPQLVVNNFGYNAGGWRVDRHPRFMADTTGDGRADIVGFGDAGVYVSRANANGTFSAPQLVVNNFGYNAGGWRVDRHPRFMADTTGDGRADIVGFGDAGVYVSRANANGTFSAPQLVVANFGYNAGGWRVDRHPRFMADTTGDGRADIVGFGDAGVYVSRANADGTFSAPQLVVPNFGYNAGGWRVDRHPRLMADTTADGRADIVGFGDAGVWMFRW
ncbi:MAG TPA: M6 family metalloprotease domain-containing protein [Vineibacter sp.]|nr:M6 family metalloprotease domain-containing protein [Vineibacter sp.]